MPRSRSRATTSFGLLEYPTRSPAWYTASTSPRRSMSASTASSAGRFAWMSETSAMRMTRSARRRRRDVARTTHHRRRRGTRLAELRRLAHVGGHLVARDRPEAEAREVPVGGGREQVEGVDATRLRVRDHPRHERSADTVRAPLGAHRHRPEQRIVAAHLEPGHADEIRPALRDDERRERVPHTVEWEAARREQLLHRAEIRRRRGANARHSLLSVRRTMRVRI